MTSNAIDLLRSRGVLSPVDEHFARTLARLAGEDDERVLLAAALVSRQVGNGHVCLDVGALPREPLADDEGEIVALAWPAIDDWLAALRASPCVAAAVDADPPPQRPLVLDQAGRLYLQRYWRHERRLARGLLARVHAPSEGAVPAHLLLALFPPPEDAPVQPSLFDRREPDWQRIAALAALERRFCVISGGPGTGKTHTVAKILALLIEQAQRAGLRVPRIQLLAPTGKAAARLKQSIRALEADLPVSPAVHQEIPTEASTIHRCLGRRAGSRTRFRHDRDDPLLADVVLVDESSMVDLALLSRLVDALLPEARLILLGDEDQLASVEAGAVFADICNTGGRRQHSRAFAARVAEVTGDRIEIAPDAPAEIGLGDAVVHLTKSWRYGEDSDIGALARAINAGDADRALERLAAPGGAITLVESGGGAARAALLALAAKGFAPYLREIDPATQLELLDQFRVLCAHRRGPQGVETLNREIERDLEQRGLLDTAGGDAYRKRPLLVTRNDAQTGLFNGDVGVVGERADAAGEIRRAAFFPAQDGEARVFPLSRLPEHETVFAMTVHKSQGSEFDHVAVVLPDEVSPVLSRELLYTAVSRAREHVTLFASREIVRATIARRVERRSGLRELLWSGR